MRGWNDIGFSDKFAKLLSHFEHIARRRVMYAYRQMIEEEKTGVERDYAFANHSVDWTKVPFPLGADK